MNIGRRIIQHRSWMNVTRAATDHTRGHTTRRRRRRNDKASSQVDRSNAYILFSGTHRALGVGESVRPSHCAPWSLCARETLLAATPPDVTVNTRGLQQVRQRASRHHPAHIRTSSLTEILITLSQCVCVCVCKMTTLLQLSYFRLPEIAVTSFLQKTNYCVFLLFG